MSEEIERRSGEAGYFHPVRTRRTFEEAVDQIVEAVRSGDLKVGDRLPSERHLAAEMEISRVTVREAIKLLSDAGIVEVQPGPRGGSFIVTDSIPAEIVAQRSDLRIGEVRAVLEARRVLEPRVAQLAAAYGEDGDFEALQRTIELQRGALTNRAYFSQLDYRFHLQIARATQNPTIVKLTRNLLQDLEIARDMASRGLGDNTRAIDIHERTLSAIKGGDMEAIEVVMDEHLGFLEQLWELETGRPRLRRVPPFLMPLSEPAASAGP